MVISYYGPIGLSLSSRWLPISGLKGEEFHVPLFKCEIPRLGNMD
jgi:hypothetical protein